MRAAIIKVSDRKNRGQPTIQYPHAKTNIKFSLPNCNIHLTIATVVNFLETFHTVHFLTSPTCSIVDLVCVFLTISSLKLSVVSLILIHSDTSVIIQSVIVTLQAPTLSHHSGFL